MKSSGFVGLLAMLAPDDRQALEERARKVRFETGARMLQEGEPGDRVIVLLSGRAKVSCASRDGREIVLDFRGPGELVGDLSAIDRGTRSSSVEALEPVEALVLATSDLRVLLARRPGLATALLEMLTRRFRDADRKRMGFGTSDTLGRVAARIAELAERYGEPTADGVVISLPISQEELAAWSAASRAGVASALRMLRELGWIGTERRRITVRDLDALRQRAGIHN